MNFILFKMFEMLLFSGRISGIIVAGGFEISRDGSSRVDFLAGDLGMKQLPTLPRNIEYSLMVAHNGTILLSGGRNNEKQCLQLNHGTWKDHSTLNEKRVWHSAVTTQAATFIFGGGYSKTTYEYLSKDSTQWLMGKNEIPGGFSEGYAIAVKSDQEIWLIGGAGTKKRILSFNVESHTFQVLPFQLNVGRLRHRCAFIPNINKIMITGGYNGGSLDSTEVLDIEDGSVTMGRPINSKRDDHGMSVVTINGENKLAVLGGSSGSNTLDSVELYNTETEKWEIMKFKLSKARSDFSFLTVKLGDILSKLPEKSLEMIKMKCYYVKAEFFF